MNGCWFWNHEWTKWEQFEITVQHESIIFRWQGPVEIVTFQKRRCLKCGKEQREEI